MATAIYTTAPQTAPCYTEPYHYGPSVTEKPHHAVTPKHTSIPLAMANSVPMNPPAILSISPPVHKRGSLIARHHGELTNPIHHLHSPALPFIHSGSTTETFRRILTGLDIDECEPAGENAFLVCNLKNVYDKYALWQSELGGLVQPFFAIKCNPDPLIIRMMIKLGVGFDCASHQEISQVINAGLGSVHKQDIEDNIIYANPCKANSFIRFASKKGVKMMTFDNADELLKIKKNHPDSKMVLRILTDDSGSLCRFGLKFGAPLSEVRRLLTKAKELDISVIGISFHVGSGCTNPHLFADAVKNAHWAFGVGKELGFDFNLLDIGGGFGGDNFTTIARVVKPVLQELFPPQSGVRIIAEPGRYFVSEAFEMATNIIARRGKSGGSYDDEEDGEDADMQLEEEIVAKSATQGEEEESIVMYYINDGVYGAFNCTMFDHQVVHPTLLTQAGRFMDNPPAAITSADEDLPEDYAPCSIWGPTCDSIDVVSKLSYLPTKHLQIGDWLRWKDMGAYTICAASQFNGFKTSTVHYTIDTNGDAREEAMLRKLLA